MQNRGYSYAKIKGDMLAVGIERLQLVGVRGFEPPTPASRRQYSTKLSYTPTRSITIAYNV